MPKSNNLSVFLLKTLNKTFEEYVVEGCSYSDLTNGHLFYKTSIDNLKPIWVDSFFGNELPDEVKSAFSVKTISAIYIIEVEISKDNKRIFALAFGYGRFLLKKEYIEEEFGVETSKHAVDSAQIKSIDTLTYDTAIKHKSIQSVSEIDQQDFSLNSDSDILKGVKGRARTDVSGDLIKGRMIGGRNSVNMSAKVDISNIVEFLKQLYEVYNSNDQKGIIYTSNIVLITDEQIKQKVNDSLIEKIKDESFEGLAVACSFVNGLIDGVSKYFVGNRDYESLGADVLSSYGDIESIKRDYLEVESENNERQKVSNLFDLIYFEVEIDKEYYLLALGKYYKISKSYKKRVDDFYNNIEVWKSKNSLNMWYGENEGQYNKEHKDQKYLVMDTKCITAEGHSKFEFCDLLSCDKEILHVKIHSGSSQLLGHLANQGAVSARALMDDELRKKIADKIKSCIAEIDNITDANQFELPEDFDSHNYTVVFVMLCKSNVAINTDRPHMSFFAKSVFRETVQEIKNLGFKVSIKAIQETKKN